MLKWEEITHDLIHTIMVPSAIYLWNERRILKQVLEGEIERRLSERRHPMALLADAALIEKGLTIAPQLIPQLAQVLADLNKLMGDIEAALAADAAAFKTPPAA